MAYTTLPSLTSWWHNLQKQSSTAPALDTCQCRPRPPRSFTHRRLTSITASDPSSHTSCIATSKHSQLRRLATKANKRRDNRYQSNATSDSSGSLGISLNSVDTNQLQTALNQAIAAEDYTLASKLRDQIQSLVGSSGTADWRQLGVPEWLADRIERMGYKYATGPDTFAIFAHPNLFVSALLLHWDNCIIDR